MDKNRSISARTGPRTLLVVGYTMATIGLLADIPTIGTSTSALISIGIAVLIGVGIVLASAGMLQLTASVDRSCVLERRGFSLHGVGLIVLLLGVLALQLSSSIADRDQQPYVVEAVLLLSAVLVVTAGAMTISGGLLLYSPRSQLGLWTDRVGTGYLVLGTALISLGVGVILGANVGYFFVLSDVASSVVEDVGAAVSACGCVLAAYSSYMVQVANRHISERQPVRRRPAMESRSMTRT